LTDGDPARRSACNSCHTAGDLARPEWNFLHPRSDLSRQAWAEAIPLQAKCGVCHALPDPSMLPRQSWTEVMSRMDRIMELRGAPKLTAGERQDILHFYLTFAPERWPSLALDPEPDRSPLRFESGVLGIPLNHDSRARPVLGHVQIVDLDRDGIPDVLVCDTDESRVNWIHRQRGPWSEETLAQVPCPAHTQVAGTNANGNLDLVVACQKVMAPTDDPVGSVILLVNTGNVSFKPVTLIDGISRVADVEPGDFDGDGDVDFVVGAYGYITSGEVGWLENQGDNHYAYHLLLKRAGAIHVLPADINGDGTLDFIALFAQEHELISAFINDGKGRFEERVLFNAGTPSFGSSGIQLVDLDGDGDLDILYTNGDNMDLPTMIPRPYHGVQWLENRGNLNFVWHNIYRYYGAYCAVAGDLNHDGKPDIVVTSMFNDWADPRRDSILWLENVGGSPTFVPHGISRIPIQLISADIGDLDGDGWADIVASGMHAFPPFDRMGRVTWWRNLHTPQ
jgi:hypothetical protein